MKSKTVMTYKGFGIDYNAYGCNEYSVHVDGDDFWFETIQEAKDFIDEI